MNAVKKITLMLLLLCNSTRTKRMEIETSIPHMVSKRQNFQLMMFSIHPRASLKSKEMKRMLHWTYYHKIKPAVYTIL